VGRESRGPMAPVSVITHVHTRPLDDRRSANKEDLSDNLQQINLMRVTIINCKLD
jgi:hypothetical protein